MREGRGQQVIAVCGVKNSGKTTLITRLTARLSDAGLKVAVIKHDGHDFACDIPGTDSWRYMQSGAYGAACFSKNRMFIHKAVEDTTARQLMLFFPEADLIIVEGMKDSSLDKIEVVRRGVSGEPVSNPAGRFLIATDIPDAAFETETADLNDPDRIAQIIRDRS